eukprot:s5494_g3.t1
MRNGNKKCLWSETMSQNSRVGNRVRPWTRGDLDRGELQRLHWHRVRDAWEPLHRTANPCRLRHRRAVQMRKSSSPGSRRVVVAESRAAVLRQRGEERPRLTPANALVLRGRAEAKKLIGDLMALKVEGRKKARWNHDKLKGNAEKAKKAEKAKRSKEEQAPRKKQKAEQKAHAN